MAQTLSKVYIHMVFSTKKRADTLPKHRLGEIHAFIADAMRDAQCPAIIVGGTTNHVHILYQQSRKTTIADTARLVKTNSSRWLNYSGSPFETFEWQDGYGAFSISGGHVEAVRQYIATQEEHHRKVSFREELTAICRKYGVEIDERYAWT